MARAKVGEENRYARILEAIFDRHYKPGEKVIPFAREDIVQAADDLEIDLPKNLGDVIYSFRYRVDLPATIQKRAPKGKVWVIRPAGRAKYSFCAVDPAAATIAPSEMLAETKIPDATPGIVTMHALNDEQALLAILRYNRLIDIFTGVACYSLQSHLRTFVTGVGQVETDEVYVGVDKRGAHFVIPVQAKGGRDSISIIQIEQDFAMCAEKFSTARCRPVAAQFMESDVIALFEFEEGKGGVAISGERHYRLVPVDELTEDELRAYSQRGEER